MSMMSVPTVMTTLKTVSKTILAAAFIGPVMWKMVKVRMDIDKMSKFDPNRDADIKDFPSLLQNLNFLEQIRELRKFKHGMEDCFLTIVVNIDRLLYCDTQVQAGKMQLTKADVQYATDLKWNTDVELKKIVQHNSETVQSEYAIRTIMKHISELMSAIVSRMHYNLYTSSM